MKKKFLRLGITCAGMLCIGGPLFGTLQELTIPQCQMDFLYRTCCLNASQDDTCFAKFKSDPAYTAILEHLGYETGVLLLDIVKKQTPHYLHKIHTFKRNDLFGGPRTRTFNGIGTISPTTLRYLKVASDLEVLFGSLDGKSIVEIGGGYGGQCLVLSMIHRFKSYTIIDLPEPLALTRKYLEKHHVDNVTYITCEDPIPAQTFDLVISNYAYAECCRQSKEKYLQNVITKSKRGYLTGEAFQDEVAGYLGIDNIPFNIQPEDPQTAVNNVIMTWE